MSTKPNPKPLIITLTVLILVGGVLGFLVFRQAMSNNGNSSGSSDGSSQQSTTDPLQSETVTTDNFTYTKPKDWAKLSKERLDASEAVSGIGLPSGDLTKLPLASTTMRVVNAVPQNDNDLKNSTTSELKRLTKYQLVESTDSTVDGKASKKFVYTFEDQDKKKQKQQLDVIVNNGKTYFVLYSASDEEFGKHIADHQSLLASFKFK